MNLAKLNHILIPTTKSGRDRLRRSLIGKVFERFWSIYLSFSREGRIVLVLWLLSGLLGLEVMVRQGYLVWCALTGALVASLILRRFYTLQEVEISVDAPKIASVGDEVPFSVALENKGQRDHYSLRVTGPLLPWDGQYLTEKKTISALTAGGRQDLSLRARFSTRGEHHLDSFVAGVLGPFSLTKGPLLSSSGVRFTVVPKIAPVERLSTPRVQRYQPGGVALSSQTGESMEVMGLRPYRAGDPLRDLHPKRWARLGFPVVREYQQEYFTRIGVVVDTDLRVADERRLEAGLSLAAGVVANLTRGEALIDLLVVGNDLHKLTVGRSLGFLDQALELLGIVKPGPPFDAQLLVSRLAPHLRQLSCVVFITLGWDERRSELVESIRGRGVACKVLQVTLDEDGLRDRRQDLSMVSVETIESSEAILL